MIIKTISEIILPLMIMSFLAIALLRKVDAYDAFLEGAKDSVLIIYNILPAIVGLMVAIGMFRASGLLDKMCEILSPLTSYIGMPKEVVPLAILRPISGSGGIAVLADILKNNPPDSFVGIVASVMAGATETTFYTIAVYFGAVGIKDSRYTLKAALIADVVGIILSVIVVKILFKF